MIGPTSAWSSWTLARTSRRERIASIAASVASDTIRMIVRNSRVVLPCVGTTRS